jgi:hypothetical protein
MTGMTASLAAMRRTARLVPHTGSRTEPTQLEIPMFHDQMINFLEAAVVFLLLTNAISVAAAAYAMRLLHGFAGAKREPTLLERKLGLILDRSA